AKLDDRAVASALDNAAMMSGDGGIDEIAAEPAKTHKRPPFVGASEPGIADDIRDQNRRELSGFAHRAPPAARRLAQKLSTQSGATPGDRKGQHESNCR